MKGIYHRQAPYIHLLRTVKLPLRRAILKHGDKQLINCLRLTCYNILRGNIKVQPRQKSVLKKQKNTLYKIARAKPESARRILVNQKGGFLPILAALAPAIGGLLGGIFSK